MSCVGNLKAKVNRKSMMMKLKSTNRDSGAKLLFLLFCLLLSFTTLSAQTPPPITVVGSEFQFGYIPYRTTAKHRVYLINNSDSVLEIKNVHTGCACTQVSLIKREAVKGDTIPIEISILTGKISKGNFVKSAQLYTNNPGMPKIEIKLNGFSYEKGDLMVPVRIFPESIPFTQNSSETEVEIRNLGSEDFQALLVSQPVKSLYDVVMPPKTIKKSGADKIKVRMKPQPKHSEFTESFTFYITDGKMTRFTVPVTLTR